MRGKRAKDLRAEARVLCGSYRSEWAVEQHRPVLIRGPGFEFEVVPLTIRAEGYRRVYQDLKRSYKKDRR